MRKLGVNCDFLGERGVARCSEAIRAAGFDSTFVGDYDYRDFAGAVAAARSAGLEVETVHAPFDAINDIWSENFAGDRMLGRLIASVEKCAELQIPVCVVHLSSGWNSPPVC